MYFFSTRVKKYEARKIGPTSLTKEILGELTVVEEQLIQTQEVIEIRGKVCLTTAGTLGFLSRNME